eukprot:140302-Pyramimonas_sp.AAC.1
MGLLGDSMLITNWMRGMWSCNNNIYRSQAGEVIDLLDGACRNFNMQVPAIGYDLWRDHFREGNERADRLGKSDIYHCNRGIEAFKNR